MNNSENFSLRPLSAELGGANYGDKRLTQRVAKVIDAVAEAPSSSLPQAFRTNSQLEAVYRLLRNPRVTPERTIEPHIEATCERIRQSSGPVLVIHDTTDFDFGESKREGLGWMKWSKSEKSYGFFGHFALAVSSDSRPNIPLGILGFQTWTRTGAAIGQSRAIRRKRSHDSNRESLRWNRLVNEAESKVSMPEKLIHISDREADDYLSFYSMIQSEQRFVTRMKHDRILAGGTKQNQQRCKEVLSKLEAIYEREVPLSKRHPSVFSKNNRIHAPRESRIAKLTFSATALDFKCPEERRNLDSPSIRVNVVRVREVDPPDGIPPVEWNLVTTEPVESPEQIAQIIDYYRARWQIEEYFKSLKTGCSFQKLQLESLTTLLNALALYMPVAWRLLLLRSMAHSSPSLPADVILTETQLRILQRKVTLEENPTIEKAMWAVAAMGGHIKNNGHPGWQVLGRGYQKLLLLEEGWLAAAAERCDQS
jgi:IS4 transposase